jgi:hypothetical protein
MSAAGFRVIDRSDKNRPELGSNRFEILDGFGPLGISQVPRSRMTEIGESESARNKYPEREQRHLDVLRDLKRIHSHICSVAYPVLEATGELEPSRLRGWDAQADATEAVRSGYARGRVELTHAERVEAHFTTDHHCILAEVPCLPTGTRLQAGSQRRVRSLPWR